MSTKINVLLLVIAFVALTRTAQPQGIWPVPSSYNFGNTAANLCSSFKITTSGLNSQRLARAIIRYQKLIANACGSVKRASRACIATLDVLVANKVKLDFGVDESYQLSVQATKATVTAANDFGALHGLDSFTQLVENSSSEDKCGIANVPVTISDKPRFEHRGILVDTSRHFMPKEALFRTFDAMTASKLNAFHWHITDSQSFPIVSTSIPELSEKGSYPNKVYTTQDVVDILAYADDRGIRVIPEFDMPGHTTSWGKAYPDIATCADKKPWGTYCNEPPCGQLNPVKNSTYDVVSKLLTEMTSRFNDSFFHLGSDEINTKCWTSDPTVQAYMKKHGLTTVNPMLQMFEDKAHVPLKTAGKTILHWQEVITDWHLTMPKDAVIQVWLSAAAIKSIVSQGYRVIDSSYTSLYLDCGTGNWINGGKSWCDPYKSWNNIYNHEPTEDLTASEAKLVIGAEACLWSEIADETNIDQKLWPRASALAERLWSPESSLDESEALPRIMQHRELLVRRGINATPVQPEWCRLNPGNCH